MRKTFIAFLALAVLAGAAAAQTPTGKIIGKAKDEQNAPLPGVSIEAESASWTSGGPGR